MRRAFTAIALVAMLTSPALAQRIADPWSDLVTSRADVAAVRKALGAPSASFTGVIDAGTRPLHIPLTVPAPAEAGEKAPSREVVRVLRYPGVEGLDYQVVLKDGRVLYAVAPPQPDEKSLDAIRKKYGTPGTPEDEGTLAADLHAAWDVYAVPKRKRRFVTRPGSTEVVARIVER